MTCELTFILTKFQTYQDGVRLIMKGWLGDLRVNVHSNSISDISGRCYVDNERLHPIEPR